ncbi:hypothetical protein Esti_000521 [Eimeria stiedai]
MKRTSGFCLEREGQNLVSQRRLSLWPPGEDGCIDTSLQRLTFVSPQKALFPINISLLVCNATLELWGPAEVFLFRADRRSGTPQVTPAVEAFAMRETELDGRGCSRQLPPLQTPPDEECVGLLGPSEPPPAVEVACCRAPSPCCCQGSEEAAFSSAENQRRRDNICIPGALGEAAGYRFALGGILVYFEGCGAKRTPNPVGEQGVMNSSNHGSNSSNTSSVDGGSSSNGSRSESLLSGSDPNTRGAAEGKPGCCCCRGCLTWSFYAETHEADNQQQQQQKADDKRSHRRSDSCSCCSLQPVVAARRHLSRCCCLCPFNDCRGPIAQALVKALEEENPLKDGPMLQQEHHEQHEQQEQQSFVSREEPETGVKQQLEVDRMDFERKTEQTLGSLQSLGRVGAAASQTEGGGASAQARGHRDTEGASRAARQPQSFSSVLRTVPGGDTSVLESLVKLPLPAPPSAPQMLETAWKPSATKLVVPRDSLVFESRFESGNLLAAVRGICEPNVYLLVLRPDAKRNNKTSWFFFSVTAPQRGGGTQGEEAPLTVTFKILNLVKSNTFYSRGLGPPFVFSSEAFRNRGEGWRRSRNSVRFYRNSAAAAVNYILEGASPAAPADAAKGGGEGAGPASPPFGPAVAPAAAGDAGCGVQHWTYDGASPALDLRGSYFSVEFEHTFEGADKVFFASCLPYTFTDVLELTAALQTDPLAKQHCAVQTLCRSPGGLPCPVFFIGDPPRGRGSLLQQHQQLQLQPRLKPFVLSASSFVFDPVNAASCRSEDSPGEHPDYALSVRKEAPQEDKATRGPLGGRLRRTAPASANQEEGSRSRSNNNFVNSSECSSSRNRSSIGDESSSGSNGSKSRESLSWLTEPRLLGSSENCGVCRGAPKPSVCISCRVHPGESNSSYVFLGLLSFLLSEAPEARLLRCLFSFVCVPCLNPDGVSGGLSRCSLHGDDLNRVWDGPCPVLHSTVFAFKQLISQLKHACSPTLLLLDLHGHSNKSDVFIHANCTEQQLCSEGPPQPPCDGSPLASPGASSKGAPPKLQGAPSPQAGPPRDSLPNSNTLLRVMEERCPWFDLNSCIFKIHRCKEGTGRVVGFRELGIVCSYTLEASVFCHAAADPQKWKAALRLDTAARGGPCSAGGPEAMEEAPQGIEASEGGAPTALAGEGPLDEAVSVGGSLDKVSSASSEYRSPDESPGGPFPERAPPNSPSNGRPYGRAPAGKSPNLLHFDAGSLMLTGVSVGLALYDWAIQILKGAPGLLQPGGPLLTSSGKPLPGPSRACARCILLGRAGPSSAVSPSCFTKPCGGLFRRRGPRRKRHSSAGSCLYEPWASCPGEEAGLLGAPTTSSPRGPPQETLQPEGPCGGNSSSPSPALEGPPQADSSGAPSDGPPPPSEFTGGAEAAAASSPPLRPTEGVLLLDLSEKLGGPQAGDLKGPPRRDKAAEGFSRGNGSLREAAAATAVAAAAAATGATAAAGLHGRGIPAADVFASPVALGAPQGPPQPARTGPLGFKGDSKTAPARLRLRMKASGRGPLAEAPRCSRSARAICSGGSHRGPRRSCCKESPLDSELVAFSIQASPSKASQPSRWEGLEDVSGALYGSTETGDSCGASEEGALAGLRASSLPCTACLTGSCHQAAAHAVKQQEQQPLWQEKHPGAPAVRGPELEWALDCITAVATELSKTKESSEQKPVLHAAPARHAQELAIAGKRSPMQTPLSAGAHCAPTWIKGKEGCCCTPRPDDPLNMVWGAPLSWGPPGPSGSSFRSPQATVRPKGSVGLTETQGTPQRKSPRSSCPQIVPASAGAPQGSARASLAALEGPLFSSRASNGSQQLPRGPLPGLDGPTVIRVTPTARPTRPRRRGEGAPKNA